MTPRRSSRISSPLRMSLRRKVLLIVLALGLIPSFITLFAFTGWAVNALRVVIVTHATDEARTHAERLGDQIQGEVARLVELAAAPEIDPEEGTYQLVSPTDDSSANALAAGHIRTVLSRAPDTEAFAFQAGEAPHLTFQIAAHVPGREHWLVRELDFSDFHNVVHALYPPGRVELALVSSRGGAVALEDRDGEIQEVLQYHPDLFGQSSGFIPQREGEKYAWAWVRVGAITGLSEPTGEPVSLAVLRRVDLTEGISALHFGFWTMAVLGVIFVAAVGAFGIWLSGRLVDPIKRLRSGFQRLEQGDLDYRIDVKTGDEIEELGESMNQMAATLQSTYRNLADKLLEIDEKARQIAITYDLAQAANRSLDLKTMVRDAVMEIHQLVAADQLALGLVEEEASHIRIIHCRPAKEGAFREAMTIPLAGSLSRGCLDRGTVKAHRLDGRGGSSEETALRGSAVQALCIVPLTTPTGPVGVLLLADMRGRQFRHQDIQILEQLAASLATAIDHSRLYARREEFAQRLEEEVVARTRELEDAQEQLVRAEKMAAFGDVAANVAHEINNPLSIIKNYIKLLDRQIQEEGCSEEERRATVRTGITIIAEEIDRIARIIDGLRSMRGEAPQTSTLLDVNQEIRTLAELFRQTFHRKNIRLEAVTDPALAPCRLSRDYVRQILINLLRNASDAIGEGGHVRIISRANTPREGMLTMDVEDDGPGIPEKYWQRIFDPFFTTKKDGKGTGLGLSISYRLASRMGGRIEIDTKRSKGARLSVILPAEREGKQAEAEEKKEQAPVRHEGGRIIIG